MENSGENLQGVTICGFMWLKVAKGGFMRLKVAKSGSKYVLPKR